MENRNKWLQFGLLFVPAFYLIKMALCSLGFKIDGKVEILLTVVVGGFLFAGIIAKKENKGRAKLIPILCLLVLLSMGLGSCYRSCSNSKDQNTKPNLKNPGQTVTITTEPPALNIWQQDVEIPGKNPEGDAFRVQKPGNYDVTYLGGDIYDTPTDRGAYDIWGAGYAEDWKESFPYFHIPDVKAPEALLIADGEVGKGNGSICQFPDGQKTVRIWINQYIRFFRHEAFKPDINRNKFWCFQNNSGSWKFRISEAH